METLCCDSNGGVKSSYSYVSNLGQWFYFSIVCNQMSMLFVEQGDTMDAHIGPCITIPVASLSIFDTINVIF